MGSETTGLDPLFITFEQFRAMIMDYLPTLALAIGVLSGGIAVAWFLKVAVLRVSGALSSLFPQTARGRSGQVRLPWPLPVIVANVIFGLAVTFFLAVTTRILGLPGVADWIAAAAAYLPHVFIASVIVLVGYMLAAVARDAIEGLGGQARSLGGVVFFLVNAVAALAALRQLGIDLVLVRSLFLIVAAAVFGGIAFAFGTGASHSLANIIAAYYVRRAYRVGQRVRVGATEGEILDITPTAVLVDTLNGRAMIPATKFNTEISMLLGREESHDDA